MKFLDYLLIAAIMAPLILIVVASYFLNRERDQDWAKPADKEDEP